jgi:hypothetical protein
MQRVLGNNDTGKRHQPDNGTGKNGTMKLTSIYEKNGTGQWSEFNESSLIVILLAFGWVLLKSIHGKHVDNGRH